MLDSNHSTGDKQVGGVFFNHTQGNGDAHIQLAGIATYHESHGTAGLGGGNLYFFTKNAGSNPGVAPRMMINHNGNIGIGVDAPTVSPDTRLDIRASGVNGLVINQDEANADISSRLFWKEQNSTIALYNTGDTFSFRTGATIGSTSGTERATINANGIAISSTGKLFFGGGSHTYIQEDTDDRLRFFTGGVEFMRFTESSTDTINFYQEIDSQEKITIGAADHERILVSKNQSASDAEQLIIEHFDGNVVFRNPRGDMQVSSSLTFKDGVKARFGNSNDLDIYHTGGGNSFIVNNEEHLIIVNNENDHDVILKSDNGSGGTTTYFSLDGSSTKTVFAQSVRVADSQKIGFGNIFKVLKIRLIIKGKVISYFFFSKPL